MPMNRLIARVFSHSADIRYVALYRKGRLASEVRPGLTNASAGESDRYEELLVNPALLTLARQRGNIDCGGLRYLVVRYGGFFQIILPLADGHLSVAVEAHANPVALAAQLANEVT